MFLARSMQLDRSIDQSVNLSFARTNDWIFLSVRTPGKAIETTNHDYDLIKFKKSAQETVIGPFIVLFLHFYLGMFPPLVVSALMNLMNSVQSELAKLHLLALLFPSIAQNKDLQRPWKAPSLMSQFNEAKREVKAQLNEGTPTRKNKKLENKRKVGKSS